MATPEEMFARQLLGLETQKEIASENPYYGVSSIPQAIGSNVWSLIKPDPATGVVDSKRLRDAAMISGISGLLSGTLGAFGDDYQEKLSQRYLNTVAQSRQGIKTTAEEANLPSRLWGSADRQGSLWRELQSQKLRDQEDEMSVFGRKENIKNINDTQQAIIKQYLSADTPQQQQQALKLLGILGGAKPDALLGAENQDAGGSGAMAKDLALGTKEEEAALVSQIGYEGVRKLKAEKAKQLLVTDKINRQEEKRNVLGIKGAFDSLADRVENNVDNWAQWQLGKKVGGSEANLIYGNILTLIPVAAKRISGHNGNLAEKEQERTIEAILGTGVASFFTMGPKAVAAKLREIGNLAYQMETGENVSENPLYGKIKGAVEGAVDESAKAAITRLAERAKSSGKSNLSTEALTNGYFNLWKKGKAGELQSESDLRQYEMLNSFIDQQRGVN